MTNLLLPPTSSEERNQTVILDAVTGIETVIAETQTTMTLDDEGHRTFTTKTKRVRTADLRLVDPATPLFACTCGKKLLTAESITYCAKCKSPVCYPCTKREAELPLCPTCYQRGWLKRFLRELFS